MNRDDVIRMAREAGHHVPYAFTLQELERFVALVEKNVEHRLLTAIDHHNFVNALHTRADIENGAAGRSDLWVDLTREECFEICTRYKDSPFSLLVTVQDALRAKNDPR